MAKKRMIGFAGLSHLGIVSSVSVAAQGFKTVGYDPSTELTDRLTKHDLPLFEPGLLERLTEVKSNISFTSDLKKLAGCDVIYISRDVPTSDKNVSDLKVVNELISKVVEVAKSGATIVVLCQVPPGFSKELKSSIFSTEAGKKLNYYYQVETLVFGNAVERALKPERYIIGCSDPRAPLPKIYNDLLTAFNCPILPMHFESAELCKIAINMFLVSSVSTTNTIAELCENIGAYWTEIAPALKLDKRIGQHAYLAPGLGIAGGNLERDLVTFKSLAARHGSDSGVVDSWIQNSSYRRGWILRTLKSFLPSNGGSLGLWGIAYKAGTNSVKNSQSVELLQKIQDYKVKAFDPKVALPETNQNHSQVNDPLAACQGSDLLVVMTPWPEFTKIDLSKVKQALKSNVVIDPFRALNSEACEKAGLRQISLGLPCY